MSCDPLQVQSWFSSEENESHLRTLSGIHVESVQTTAVYTHDCLRTLPVSGQQMLLVFFVVNRLIWRPTFGCWFLPRIAVCHATLYLYMTCIYDHIWSYTVPIGSMYAIYGNMDPINIPPMLVYIPYMDPMGYVFRKSQHETHTETPLEKPGRGLLLPLHLSLRSQEVLAARCASKGYSYGGFKGLVYLPLLSLLLLRMGFFNPKKSCHLTVQLKTVATSAIAHRPWPASSAAFWRPWFQGSTKLTLLNFSLKPQTMCVNMFLFKDVKPVKLWFLSSMLAFRSSRKAKRGTRL